MDGIAGIIEKRSKRCIAIVLAAKEKEADPHISPDAQARLRKVVLDQFNDLMALAVDVVEVAQRDSVMNELFVERINEIHSAIMR